jgi:DDE_Tnp_1-associated
MTSGFKSPNSSPVQIPKALVIANAAALTEKMSLIFNEIDDPRVEKNRVHLLTDILIIAILSVIAGARGWEDIQNYRSFPVTFSPILNKS